MKNKRGIFLHVGCGLNKQPQFVGIDKRKLDGVDIVHDLERFPYPIKSNECLTILASNGVLSKIKPWNVISFMDEMWRMLKPDCQLVISVPYGKSELYIADPTNCSMWTEQSFLLFDCTTPNYMAYMPKPWKIEAGFPMWQNNGMIEVVMRKVDKN